MKKKWLSLSLALILTLSLFAAAPISQAQEAETTPAPVVTGLPEDPDKPEEPPVLPQDLPTLQPIDQD